MFVHLHESKFFFTLGLRSGYYHIRHSPETWHKSAITTIFVKYKFIRMQYELAQEPAYFTTLM